MKVDIVLSMFWNQCFLLYFLLLLLMASCCSDSERNEQNDNHYDSCINCPLVGSDSKIKEIKKIKKNGVCYCHYSLGKEPFSISFYLGRINDTIFLVKNSDIRYKSPMKLVFLPLNSKKDLSFSYSDYMQYSDSMYVSGDAGNFQLLSKKVMKDDTLYTFTHTCVPSEIIEITRDSPIVIPSITRMFTISLMKGFIFYKETNVEGYKKVKFYWE